MPPAVANLDDILAAAARIAAHARPTPLRSATLRVDIGAPPWAA
ncbi:hypothetical protein WCE34_04970 [Luteimonas sp. MJ204]